jgi:heat shock protein HtpX
LEGAKLTGDPAALTSALQKLERIRGRNWQGLLHRGHAIPQLLLCSHPPTEERIRRLLELRQPEQYGSWIPPQAALERIPDATPQSEPCQRGPAIWS